MAGRKLEKRDGSKGACLAWDSVHELVLSGALGLSSAFLSVAFTEKTVLSG